MSLIFSLLVSILKFSTLIPYSLKSSKINLDEAFNSKKYSLEIFSKK